MAKLPYFPFYIQDFITDGKVEAMTTTEVGAYLLLLCKAWFENPPGSLPDAPSILQKWARLDAHAWSMCSTAVLACFTLDAHDGRWHQKRMEIEHAKMLKKHNTNKLRASRAATVRWEKPADTSNATSMPQGFSDARGENAQASEASGERESISIPSSPKGKKEAVQKPPLEEVPGFDRFWEAYPRRENKLRARVAWNKHVKPELVEQVLQSLEVYKRSEQWSRELRFIPHATTWLNGKCWEDELQESNGTLFYSGLEKFVEGETNDQG